MAARKDGQGQRSDYHEEDVLDRPFDRALALRLFRYALPYRHLMILSLVLILVSTGLALLGPLLIKEAIDGPLSEDPSAGGSWYLGWLRDLVRVPGEETRRQWLLAIVGVYGALVVLQFAARFAHTVVTNVTGQNVTRDLRLQLFRHLQGRPLAYFEKHPVGRLVTRVTSDVEALNELFTTGVLTFISDLLTVFGIVIVLFVMSPPLALIVLSVIPPLLGVTFLFRTMARKYYREIRRRIAHLNAFAQEAITGMDIIQLSRREEAQAQRYDEINRGGLEAWLKSVFWYSVFFPTVDILMMISVALVVSHGGTQILAGTGISFGDFFLFWTFLNRIFTPIRGLAERYNTLQAAMAASERVFGVLDDTASIPRAHSPLPAQPLEESIRFENVSFCYEPRKTVIQNVSFEVKRGEMVALVGATGAGKSTVVNLLLRFYDPTSGRILVDGTDVRDLALDQHRARFGLVLQDVAIFSRSIAENIDLDRGIPEAQLRHGAAQVHVDRFAERLDGGYQARMMERGRTLSSGERQLLAFARALAGDPAILVLDEATSHVDSDTEALIQDALGRLIEGRTRVVVAHRLSTIRHADRILVFHHGELREQGGHEELLARGGIYARLYKLQFGKGDLDHGAA